MSGIIIASLIILAVVILIALYMVGVPYGIWWALTYFKLLNVEWNFWTWLAIFILWSVISGIGAKLKG